MVADFLFGFSLIFIMIILLAAVMSICPKWGFALASKEVKEALPIRSPISSMTLKGLVTAAGVWRRKYLKMCRLSACGK